MTGFGRGEKENEEWRVLTFIKSVNGKSLDIYIKSNINILQIERHLRDRVKEHIRRGTISVNIEVEPKETQLAVDVKRLKKNVELVKSLAKEFDLNVSDDLVFNIAWRYSEKLQEEMNPNLIQVIEESLELALKELIKSREEEGLVLKTDMEERLRRIQDTFGEILQNKDGIYESLKSKVLDMANELGLNRENPIVLNEMTFLLSKMDIEEEVTRFKAHLSKVWDVMNAEGEIGKKLDFMFQELQREINTLGNKLPGLSHYVVEIKTEIDRLKQQSANLE